MSIPQSVAPTHERPLRLWPGVAAAVLMCVMRFVVPIVLPESMMVGILGSALAALAILVWWVFFSRAPWSERLGAVVLMIVALAATKRLVHESIAGGGMGMLLYIWAIPILGLALVAWAAASRGLESGPRRASMVAAILIACGIFTPVRTGGVTSDVIGSELHWRWTPTPEERLLAHASEEPAPLPPTPGSRGNPEGGGSEGAGGGQSQPRAGSAPGRAGRSLDRQDHTRPFCRG